MSHQAACLQVHSLWHGSPAGIKFAGTFALTWLITQHVCRYSHWHVCRHIQSDMAHKQACFQTQLDTSHKPACLQTHSVWHGPQTSMFADTFSLTWPTNQHVCRHIQSDMAHKPACLQTHSVWHGLQTSMFADTFTDMAHKPACLQTHSLTWLTNQHVCRHIHWHGSQTSMFADTFTDMAHKPACLQTHSLTWLTNQHVCRHIHWHGSQTSMFADTFTDMAHKPACLQTHSLWCGPPAGIMFVSTFTPTWFTNLCYIYRHTTSHTVHQLVLCLHVHSFGHGLWTHVMIAGTYTAMRLTDWHCNRCTCTGSVQTCMPLSGSSSCCSPWRHRWPRAGTHFFCITTSTWHEGGTMIRWALTFLFLSRAGHKEGPVCVVNWAVFSSSSRGL